MPPPLKFFFFLKVSDHNLLPSSCLPHTPLRSLHAVRLDVLLRGVVQEGCSRAGGRGKGGVHGGRSGGGGRRAGGGGSRGAGGVVVAQEAGWGGGVWVLLLEGGLGVLGVGCTVVQVGASADRRGNLSGQHQGGLHICLWVDERLG